jgi:hypothetical protein
MLEYPSISHYRDAPIGLLCYVFEKYDGSNLRWEWSRNKGWYKFGTRTSMFDRSTPLWSQAIPIFMNEMADVIEDEVRYEHRGIQRFTVFTEFFGASSFAGNHKEDEPKKLILLDVHIDKRGFMSPKDFTYMFADVPWQANMIYKGNMNAQFIEEVKNGKHTPGGEGVVCKGSNWTAKIKTDAWLQRLKTHYGQDWEKHS